MLAPTTFKEARVRRIAMMAAALLLLLTGGVARAGNVGFTEVSVPNGDEPPLKVGIWYPTDAAPIPMKFSEFVQTVAPGAPVRGERLPLIVMSHGSGGWYGGHYDTAVALARAGFVAAAVTHYGDSYDEPTRAAMIWRRPAQLKRLTDYMLAAWPDRARLDASRVGVFGFSAGGFTALVAAGGVPDLAKVAPYCKTHPDTFTCGVVRKSGGTLDHVAELPRSAWVNDARIKAAVVAAPAVGFSFGKAGLKGVTVPVQLWRAEYDHILPQPDYAEAVRLALPRRAEYHVVANADHYDFLAPCPAALAANVPEICQSRPGFDRAAFHAAFDRDVVAFFQKALR
jgi:predicted dienelactone hydrolase